MFLLKFLDTRFAETALRLFCGYNGIFLRFCDKLQDRGFVSNLKSLRFYRRDFCMRVIRVVCPLMSPFGRFLDYERRCVCVSILAFRRPV